MHLHVALLFSNSISLFCYRCSKLGNFQNGKKRFFLGANSFDKKHKQKTKKQILHKNALEHLL